MELGIIVLRTIFIYFFILVIMRIMGKREIGKLSLFDLVVSIMIAELAVISIENVNTPMLSSLLPIIILFITQMLLSYISLKSQKIQDIVDGKPSVLIEHGEIREEELKKQRYTLDDLLMQLREKQIHSINQVEFAILEPSGKLTVFPKSEEDYVSKKDLNIQTSRFEFPTVLIKDGIVLHSNLEKLDKNNFWLKAELKRRIGVTNFKHISFCSIDKHGHWYIDIKDNLPKK